VWISGTTDLITIFPAPRTWENRKDGGHRCFRDFAAESAHPRKDRSQQPKSHEALQAPRRLSSAISKRRALGAPLADRNLSAPGSFPASGVPTRADRCIAWLGNVRCNEVDAFSAKGGLRKIGVHAFLRPHQNPFGRAHDPFNPSPRHTRLRKGASTFYSILVNKYCNLSIAKLALGMTSQPDELLDVATEKFHNANGDYRKGKNNFASKVIEER
jgi:hypothetical protein